MLKFLPILSILLAASAQAAPCQTDFCVVSQTMREMYTYEYNQYSQNCVDLAYKAWELLQKRGFHDKDMSLKTYKEHKGYPPHAVLVVKGKWVLSFEENGGKIYGENWLNQLKRFTDD